MAVKFTILGQEHVIECAESDQRRLEVLAQALEARLRGIPVETDATRRLVIAALALMDEVQATNVALVLAREENERLTDMVVDARLEAEAAAPATRVNEGSA
jgi:cell division protein ZapA (FtsZ GTPase activity inhibitor)